ncbi:MAG: aminoacyl-tRNA hydrolase [Planctomycetota bacterium]|nr:aminoacyl-tRNA hydrolase [Planctomycetota bacterium]
MRLVVGLGNPGSEFVGTRHNVGWEALDELAIRLGWIAKREDFARLAKNRFDGLLMDGSMSIQSSGSERLMLLKPTTYMNRSGQSVQAAMAFYQVTPVDVMVVLDDLALPCGKLRIRKGGSSGGHNGLKDIERLLGTQDYPRLRLGIDAPPPRIPGRDYVLGRFTEAQRTLLEPALDRSVAALTTWIERGIDAAMNAYNGEDEKNAKQ